MDSWHAALLPPQWPDLLLPHWFHEDLPALDLNAALVAAPPGTPAPTPITAHILLKSPRCCLAGAPFVHEICRYAGCTVAWHVAEGAWTEAPPDTPRPVATLTGPPRAILQAERIALNVLARASAIATCTRSVLDALVGYPGRIAATRKTTPGFRLVEKYAVLVGGGDTHRFDASSSGLLMLKDTHLAVLRGCFQLDLPAAVVRARQLASITSKIEVECGSLEEAVQAARAGADLVMLDNTPPALALPWVRHLRALFPALLIELSGGITPANIHAFLPAQPDIISMGALIHAPPPIDFALRIINNPAP